MWAGSAGWRPAPQWVGVGAGGHLLPCGPRTVPSWEPKGREASPGSEVPYWGARGPTLPSAGWPCSISAASTGGSQLGWGGRHPQFGSDFFCQGAVGAEQSRGAFSPKETNTAFPERLSGWQAPTAPQLEEALPRMGGSWSMSCSFSSRLHPWDLSHALGFQVLA